MAKGAAISENTQFVRTSNKRLDLTATRGYFVDVSAGIDLVKGEAFWTIITVDPNTGDITQDALTGFLPPNNADGIGDGFVNYTIKAKRDVPTGTVIDAKATIVFDTEAPIDTPDISNTLDSEKPSSSVETLPNQVNNPEFLVKWTGNDDANGSGIASFDIYVSENNGQFVLWLDNTTLNEATYLGQSGKTYGFYSVAVDNAGNAEGLPITAQARTTINNSSGNTITGTPNNDSLIGNTGDDLLIGLAGNDRLCGKSGNDTFDGGEGTDTLYESADVNFTVTEGTLTGLGTDTFSNIEIVRLLGGVSDNNFDASTLTTTRAIFSGKEGNDSFIGGGNNLDTVYESADVDFIVTEGTLTGLGTDTFSHIEIVQLLGGVSDNNFDASALTTTRAIFGGKEGNDSFIGGGNNLDTVYESADVNFTVTEGTLTGLGNDTFSNIEIVQLRGGNSNNTLDASALTTIRAFLYGQNGDDTISGSKANDILSGGAGNDTLNGGAGTDYLQETADVNFTVTEGILTGLGTDTFSNIEIVQLFGGNSNNTLDASALTTTRAFLYGQNGDDLLTGGAANDTLFGGLDDDTLIGGMGNDTVSYYTTLGSVSVNLEIGNANDGQGGTDTLSQIENIQGSNTASDNLTGDANNNTLYGYGGNDTLNGGDGNDTLVGGTGNDLLTGGNGTDTAYYYSVTGAVIANLATGIASDGEGGTDTLSQIEKIIGSNTAGDNLTGNMGINALYGYGGADILTGGGGNDSLYVGSDTVTDTVNYASGDGTDTVYNFVRGVGGDILKFTSITAIDVQVSGTSTLFKLGDGLTGNAGFGTGTLLLTTSATTGFTATDIGVNLLNVTNLAGFFFS